MPSIQYYNSIVGTQVKVSGESVGIGTDTPECILHIEKSGDACILTRDTSDASYAGLLIRDSGNQQAGSFQYGGHDAALIANEVAAGSRQSGVPFVLYQGDYNSNGGFRPEDRRMSFNTDGNVYFYSGVNVGIGTALPSVKLDVSGAINSTLASNNKLVVKTNSVVGKLQAYDSTSSVYAGAESNSHFVLRSNNTDRLTLYNTNEGVWNEGGLNYDFRVEGSGDANLLFTDASSDRVGIGTAAPLEKLHIESTILHSANATNRGQYIDVDGSITSSATSYILGTAIDARKNIANGVTDTGYIMGGDFVGVVEGGGSIADSYGVRTYAGIHTAGSGTITNAFGVRSRVLNLGIGTITNGYGLYIDDVAATNGYGIFQIGSNDDNYFAGSVGIGTTNPGAFSSSFNQLVIGDGGSYKGATIYSATQGTLAFGDTATSTQDGYRGYLAYIHSNDYMVIGTSGAERIRIAGDGKVGIGTDTPTRQFHTDGTTALIADGSAYELDISASAATLGGNRFQLLGTETVFNNAGGNFDFRVESSGEQNSLFVRGSDGNVGIGTDTPSHKLHVTESAYIQSGIISPTIAFRTYNIPISGPPIYDGFIAYTNSDCWGSGNNNNDGFVFEKTDGNQSNPDGGIFFNVRGSGGISSTAMSINGSKEIFIGQTGTYIPQGYSLNVKGGSTLDSLNINNAFAFPTGDGTNSQVLATDGNGNVSWSGISDILSGFSDYEVLTTSKSTFTVNGGYTVGSLDVYYNGLKLIDGDDYTATNGTTFTLATAAGSADVIEWEGHRTAPEYATIGNPGNYRLAISDGSSTSLNAQSDLVYDATGLGVGTSSPSYKLDVNGTFSANSVNVSGQYTFPSTDGSAGQSLVTDGNGNVAWSGVSGGSTSLASISVTSSQSLFNMTDSYSSGGLAVYLNGIKLVSGDDFTETSSTSFTLASPAASGDIVEYVAYGSTVASTNLQKTGDTMTGNLTVNADLIVKGYKETHIDNGNTGTSQTISISNSTLQTYTLTGNCTFTMPTADAGRSFTVFLKTGAGSYTASFTNVKWPQNSAPTITTSATRMDILTFYSDGTNWYGNVAQDYYL